MRYPRCFILVVDLTRALIVKLLKKSNSPRCFDPHIGACVNTDLLSRLLTFSLAQSLTVCRVSVVITAYGFEFSRPGSNPEWGSIH